MTRKRKPKQPKNRSETQKKLGISHPMSTQSSKLSSGTTGHLLKEEHHLFAGPLPPPVILDQYNNIIPDGAERIMVMAENQSLHRRQLEKQALEAEIEDKRRQREAEIDDERHQRTETRLGQVFGLLVVVFALIASVVIIILVPGPGGATTSSILGGGGLTGLVYAFHYSKSKTTKPSDNQKSK
ncbi:MAG: DUF2335 domain-containing protein [Phycisphaerae bacterium]|nr:DUF2335 domain-containing protein [Phycisphaerae bacterium]